MAGVNIGLYSKVDAMAAFYEPLIWNPFNLILAPLSANLQNRGP